jgi:hypothetical protein
MSARRSVGRPEEAPDLIDLARDYERSDLPDRQKVALRFVDAFLTDPRRLDDTARTELESCLSTEEIVDLLFKIVSHTADKPLIVIGLDAPIDPDRLTAFSYSEKGEMVIELPGAVPAP